MKGKVGIAASRSRAAADPGGVAVPASFLGLFALFSLFFLSPSLLWAAEKTCCSQPPTAGNLRFDFESGGLGQWKVEAGKFGALLCGRKTFHNDPATPYNKEGLYFLSTLETRGGGTDDGMTGAVMSPVFVLEGPEMSFLVGGGNHAGTYVALCTTGGRRVRAARGGNTEVMRRVTWSAPELVGRKVFLVVVDEDKGPWGHVTFDDFTAEGTVDAEATADRPALWAKFEKKLKEENRRREAARRVEEEARRLRHEQKVRRRLEDPALLAPGRPRVYRGEHLGAISFPIGGIAAGTIQIDGKAKRSIWQIFNNFKGTAPPHTFFAVRAVVRGREPVVRALQTEPEGPFAEMERLSFRGEYPFAWYDFEDRDLPVRVGLEALSPLIPLDAKNSSIPCALFTFSAENRTGVAVEVSFLAAQQNAVGLDGSAAVSGRRFPGYGGNVNTVKAGKDWTILHMTAAGPEGAGKEKAAGAAGTGSAGEGAAAGRKPGDMALLALARRVTARAAWPDEVALFEDFRADGRLEGPAASGPSPEGETVDGALCADCLLGPGGKRTVTFVLAWFFPEARHGGAGKWVFPGNMYANWWKDAFDVAAYVKERFPVLEAATRLYHDTLYSGNMPRWLLDRITSQVAVLRSKTCFWSGDGYFGAFEGCCRKQGCCHGNCAHVWHYAQAHARLFPEIARRMREETFGYESAEGALPYRHPDSPPAFDGQCGEILEAYREHLCGTSSEWLEAMWPKVKKAMEYTISRWDGDEDGVLSGPQHNTLDGSLGGSTSWLGTMYLSALEAAARMADLEGDGGFAARCRRIRASGAKKQNATLWNGEYYFQIPDPTPRRDYDEGCSIDQVLGEWWAGQLGFAPSYPPDRVRTALKSLLRYNFRADFYGIEQKPRKFVADGDAGMQMITWPKGERPVPAILYGDEVMSGFEYAAAAAMVQYGLMKEGYMAAKAVSDRYDGRPRRGLTSSDTASWGYSGNPFGDDECGKFYARAMSSWSLLLASQGFVYDGPAGLIGFRPVWRPWDHRSFFTAAEGWGLFTQERENDLQCERIAVRYGRLRAARLLFALPPGSNPAAVEVTLSGKPLAAAMDVVDGEVSLSLEPPVTVKAGESLEVTLR